MRGIVFEALGQNKDSIRDYEKFLTLWQSADPILPEVDDARKRLAGLRE